MKSQKGNVIFLRYVPRELKRDLRRGAKKHRQSLNAFCLTILEEFLESRKKAEQIRELEEETK